MRSLQESLFGDNIKKNPTIREAYHLLAGDDGFRAGGMLLSWLFMEDKLIKYPNPYPHTTFGDGLAGLAGIIADLSCPLEKDYNKGNDCDWSKNAIKVLSKYVKRSWKQEFNKNFKITVRKSFLGKNKIDICMELYDSETGFINGFYEFTFGLN